MYRTPSIRYFLSPDIANGANIGPGPRPVLRLARLLLAAVCASLFCLPTAYADEPLRVNVDAESPPFMSVEKDKAVGIYPAIVRAVFARMNMTINVEGKPWKRALAEVDAGQAGIAGIYKNEERLKKYDFSEPILNEFIAVYYSKKKPLTFSKLSDLQGKRLGVLRGWYYSDAINKARQDGVFTAEEVNGDIINFEKLSAGRLDAVLAIEQSGTAQLKSGKFADIEMSKAFADTNQGHLAFNKSAKQTALLDKFNHALAAMKKDGSLNKLVAQELAK